MSPTLDSRCLKGSSMEKWSPQLKTSVLTLWARAHAQCTCHSLFKFNSQFKMFFHERNYIYFNSWIFSSILLSLKIDILCILYVSKCYDLLCMYNSAGLHSSFCHSFLQAEISLCISGIFFIQNWFISYCWSQALFDKANCMFAHKQSAHIYTNCLTLRVFSEFFRHMVHLLRHTSIQLLWECGKALETAVSVLYYSSGTDFSCMHTLCTYCSSDKSWQMSC